MRLICSMAVEVDLGHVPIPLARRLLNVASTQSRLQRAADQLPKRHSGARRSVRRARGGAEAARLYGPPLGDGRAARRTDREHGRDPRRWAHRTSALPATSTSSPRAKAGPADPFAAEIQDGLLIGRGANDMKSAIAAYVAALSRARRHRRHAVAADHRRRGRLFDLGNAADHRLAQRARRSALT